MERSEVNTDPVWVEFVNLVCKLLVFEVEVKRQHVNTGAPEHGICTDRTPTTWHSKRWKSLQGLAPPLYISEAMGTHSQ